MHLVLIRRQNVPWAYVSRWGYASWDREEGHNGLTLAMEWMKKELEQENVHEACYSIDEDSLQKCVLTFYIPEIGVPASKIAFLQRSATV